MITRCLRLSILLVLITSACVSSVENPIKDENVTIPEIQGCSHKSPLSGRNIEDVRGIVTAKAYNGFYMQSRVPDELDCSSEGIFVFTGQLPEVFPGDEVSVNGVVQEFLPGQVEDKNLTISEIVDPEIRVISSGNSLPDEVKIGSDDSRIPESTIDNDRLRTFDPGEDGLDYYESLESMLVQVEGGVVVGPRNPFNEVVIIPQPYGKLNIMSSVGALIQTENDANPERLILNLNQENKQQVNIGATLQNQVHGVMDYSYGNYKIRTFGIIDFSEVNPVRKSLDFNENTLTLVTYNVENLSLQDNEKKFRAIASDITGEFSAPDIVVLHEVMDDSGSEDDGTISAGRTIARLVDEISRSGGPVYSFLVIDPVNNKDGGITGGNIRSVILYRSDSGIKLVEGNTLVGLGENPGTIGTANWPFSVTRKPLAALFDWKNHQFLVVVVHLTSRGLDSPLFGSVQPIERLEEEKRIAQADKIDEFLRNFKAENPGAFIILAGDVNDDPWSKTLSVLTSRTLYDAGKEISENERFSYILDGNAIQLDHILVSDPSVIVQYAIPHLNSIYDHQLQVSDHDPVLVELDFDLPD